MTSPKSSITFPILNTFLKLLTDRQWHNCHLIKNQWKQSIPPEYFARRKVDKACYSKSKGKVVSNTRTVDGIARRDFNRMVSNSLNSEFIEIRELGAKRFENYDIRLTGKGMIRVREGITGTRFITHNGETHSMTGFCKKHDLDVCRFRFWLDKKKVPLEEAMAKAKKGAPWATAKLLTYAGETKTIAEWCRIWNVNRSKFDYYIKTMTVEGAIERSREKQE